MPEHSEDLEDVIVQALSEPEFADGLRALHHRHLRLDANARHFIAKQVVKVLKRRAATIYAPIPVIDSDPIVLGEHLREVTFTGEGLGCYETFDVRPDAEDLGHEAAMEFFDVDPSADWPLDVKFEGRRFHYQGLTVECYWFWDGDGTLAFRITHPQLGVLRVIENDDCKKSYCWEDADHG